MAEDKFLAQIPEQYRNDRLNGFNYAQAAALFNRFDKEYYQSARVRYQGADTPETFGENQAESDYNANRLTDEEYGLYQVWAGSKGSRLYREGVGEGTRDIVDTIEDVFNRSVNQIEQQRLDYIKDYYQQNYVIGQQQAYRVPLGDAKQKDAFRPVLNSLAEVG